MISAFIRRESEISVRWEYLNCLLPGSIVVIESGVGARSKQRVYPALDTDESLLRNGFPLILCHPIMICSAIWVRSNEQRFAHMVTSTGVFWFNFTAW